jgi:hypothetical protein
MNDKSYIDEFLTEIEREAIIRFNSDVLMKGAVKKVLLRSIHIHGTQRAGEPCNPLINRAFALASHVGEHNNEEIGQDVRALWEGINALEDGFQLLDKYKVEKPVDNKEKVNKAL